MTFMERKAAGLKGSEDARVAGREAYEWAGSVMGAGWPGANLIYRYKDNSHHHHHLHYLVLSLFQGDHPCAKY